MTRANGSSPSVEAWIALVITGDDRIRSLNRDFLGIDAPTDVLAFPTQEEGGPFVAAPEAGGYLGDGTTCASVSFSQSGDA